MRILDCIEINGKTLMVLDNDLPSTGWRDLVIDGTKYATIPVMDIGDNSIAIDGIHDFTGKEVTFA